MKPILPEGNHRRNSDQWSEFMVIFMVILMLTIRYVYGKTEKRFKEAEEAKNVLKEMP